MPGVDLPADAEISYNAYNFGVTTKVESVRSKPNYDSSGRQVASTTLALTLSEYITPDPAGEPDTRLHIGLIRNYLTQPGGNLVLKGLGFGELGGTEDLDVNPPGGGGVRDVAWGPKPQILQLSHLGEDQAWKLVWEVQTTILDQCSEPTYTKKIMEFAYKVSYDISRSGYSRRTYTGHLRIPQSKTDVLQRTLSDNADAYLESVLPKIQLGFRRESQQRELSEDKCGLTFTVVDSELPGQPPPPNVIISDVRRRDTAKGPIFLRNTTTVTGRYELPKGTPKSDSWKHFERLIFDTTKNTVNTLKKRSPTTTLSFIPLSIQLDSGDLHGAEAGSFTYTYAWTLAKRKAKYLMEAAGLWRMVPGSDIVDWSRSMEASDVSSARAYAQLTFNNSDDKLVDLCKVYPPTTPAEKSMLRKARIEVAGDSDERSDVNFLNMIPPDPDSSWIDYSNRLRIIQIDNTAVHQPLPTRPTAYTPVVGSVGATEGFKTGFGNDNPPIIQMRGPPLMVAVLVGYAIRAGYAISPPNLTAIGGVSATPINTELDYFETDLVGWLGVPVVAAFWSRRFILGGVPQTGILPPDNPISGNVANDDKIDGFFVPAG